jgi:hypothetical protein
MASPWQQPEILTAECSIQTQALKDEFNPDSVGSMIGFF